MFNFNNEPQNQALDKVISDLLEDLEGTDTGAEEYSGKVDDLVKLIKLKNESLKTEHDIHTEDQKVNLDAAKINSETEKIRIDDDKLDFEKEKLEFEKEKNNSWRPSTDAIVGAAASIIGIVAILHYEKLGVVTSKALAFVGRSTK